MVDYYLENPERLKGQPKLTIGEYARSQGILVPQIFNTLEEALESGKNVIFRSEHPQEYDGVSGILDSLDLNDTASFEKSIKGAKNIDEVKRRYFVKWAFYFTRDYESFCQHTGLDVKEFIEQTSFSMWEKIKGANQTIIADSAVAGRYHIMTRSPALAGAESKLNNHSYVIIDNNEVTEFLKPLSKELSDHQKLISLYEKVRNLDNFNPNHCPIMEFQTTIDGEKTYFLQYHRTRDFSPATFTLDRKLEEGEIEAQLVRGATPKEGLDLTITIYYGSDNEEDGAIDYRVDVLFGEINVRNRKLQIIGLDESKEYPMIDFTLGHRKRSLAFKPEISIVLPNDILFKDNEVFCSDKDDSPDVFSFYDEAKKGHNANIRLHIEADGERAIIKRI